MLRHAIVPVIVCLALVVTGCPTPKPQMAATCSEATCQEECGAQGLAGTCAEETCQCEPFPGLVAGSVCVADEECQGDATHPGRCVQGFCFFQADGDCADQGDPAGCPAGYLCYMLTGIEGGLCRPECSDGPEEPNETRAAATLAASGTTDHLQLCGSDNDYWTITVPAGQITTVVMRHLRALGDLDLVTYDAAGRFMDSRLGIYPYSGAGNRAYETDEEAVSFYNASGADDSYVVRVVGARTSYQNLYALTVTSQPYEDGDSCTTAGFTRNECYGRGANGSGLLMFPFPDGGDGYVGDGYMFDSVSNYRWLRREAIMMVRRAIARTQDQFPNTKPLGLIVMCQHDGITPGYDVEDPRHPESTHDQGGNLDIAYYQTGSDNHARVVCGPNESNTDGYNCTADATTEHIVDLPRQVYFMAQLFDNPRLRVIGADVMIAPLLVTEAQRQYQAGIITASQRDGFTDYVASGDGWPFHHHHIHVSMEWW